MAELSTGTATGGRTGTDPTKLTSGSLIAAEKVNGVNVYNPQGEKLGEIDDLMIDKISGRVAYAVLSFGGFLGMGDKKYPLPWSVLTYDKQQEGFVINLDKETLRNAPALDDDSDSSWTPEYGRNIDQYYNTPSLWM
jgi:sporulation protein YlmC with PRC-barrel domain